MERPGSITVVLADDVAIMREGIAAKIRQNPELVITGQCASGESALKTILALKPAVAVLDLHLPGLGGAAVVRRLRLLGSATKLIILSIAREQQVVRDLFRDGADGYVLKDGPAGHLLEAIDCVMKGGRYLTPLLDREILELSGQGKDPLAVLSKREWQVFSFLVDGMRPKDIAKLLAISPKTVDTYRANIMRKLDVDGIAGLIRLASSRPDF